MDRAIRPLLEKDVYNISLLIEALTRISNNNSSRQTTEILNKVEKYLNHLNTNDSESLQEQPMEWIEKCYKFFNQGLKIHSQIICLSSEREKELIALGYYLQGELSTEEEISYIKKVLRSYLKTIDQFRNYPSLD